MTISEIDTVPFVDLAAQYATLKQEVNSAIANVLHNTDFILGKDVSLFEEEFAAYCGVTHGIGVDSGTSALELLLLAFGIGPGDEVITAANTFIATVLAISYTGATPVLVDIDPDTYTLDPAQVEGAITPRTKAIIPVHLYGHPADMDAINRIAQCQGLFVIEDAAQAHGARYKGNRAGSLADGAAFSFYPAKNLGAYGDGGMVVCHDPKIAERVRMLRNYGQEKKYHHIVRGFNRRLDTLQAAVLRVKLRYMDEWNAKRARHAQQYAQSLDALHTHLHLPVQVPFAQSVYHLYVVRVQNRAGIQAHLEKKGIATGVHYPIPIHLQPAYQDLGYGVGDFPITERYAQQLLSLPMYPELTRDSIDYVTSVLRTAVTAAETHSGAARAIVSAG
jgi:dTDP-4-amino-4,6-dideoxygalactose transaminase